MPVCHCLLAKQCQLPTDVPPKQLRHSTFLVRYSAVPSPLIARLSSRSSWASHSIRSHDEVGLGRPRGPRSVNQMNRLVQSRAPVLSCPVEQERFFDLLFGEVELLNLVRRASRGSQLRQDRQHRIQLRVEIRPVLFRVIGGVRSVVCNGVLQFPTNLASVHVRPPLGVCAPRRRFSSKDAKSVGRLIICRRTCVEC